ncbi:hypothetical protein HMPREF3293_01836 [Christensenella minuta]|uniref:Uncharacterized protein n=1 Tax=Christensenella minuta TaxID=626937 RepID=A0A136Q3N0_9FIRM|nr:hypothetical protein HMPREF3293_01836 [Christensenella minuta]
MACSRTARTLAALTPRTARVSGAFYRRFQIYVALSSYQLLDRRTRTS